MLLNIIEIDFMIIETKNRKFLVDEETPIKGGDFFISIYGDNTYRVNYP